MMTMRVVDNNESNGNGGKSNGDGMCVCVCVSGLQLKGEEL